MSRCKFLLESLSNKSHITFEDFSCLTWFDEWELNWKVVLDIWTWLNDIWVNLARQNSEGVFFHLDPAYMYWYDWMVHNALETMRREYSRVFSFMGSSFEKCVLWFEDIKEKKDEIMVKTENLIKTSTILNQFLWDVESNKDQNIHRIAWVWEVLPIGQWKVDYVIMSGFLYASKRPDLVISEVERVLNDDWELIIVDYNNDSKILLNLEKVWIEVFKKWETFFCAKIKLNDLSKLNSLFEETNEKLTDFSDQVREFEKLMISKLEELFMDWNSWHKIIEF